jgi:SAM-dependent methyltransferase
VYFSEPQLGALYGQQPENMGDAPLWARQRTQAGYCELLRKHSPMTGTYLELGCDIGLLAQLCARAGRFERFWLYEPNRETHDEVRARLAGHDLSLRTAAFSAAELPASSVSTVVMVHVLDHLLEPLATTAAVARVLQPGGVALIVTHDVGSALARVLGRRWPPFTLQHPQLFTAATLARLVRAGGLEPLAVVRTVNHFPLMHLVRAVVAVFGGPGRILARHDGPAVPIRLGNIAMVARKA